ncbi:MAG: RidA family protein, partial [Devosia sp.]
MSIVRYGTGGKGAGGQPLPFARAVKADGWLHVSGQVGMENGEIVTGGLIAETHRAIQNLI